MRVDRDAQFRHWIFSHITLWNDNRNYCNKMKSNISMISSTEHDDFTGHFKFVEKRSKY